MKNSISVWIGFRFYYWVWNWKGGTHDDISKHEPKGTNSAEVKLGVGLVMSSQAMLPLCSTVVLDCEKIK